MTNPDAAMVREAADRLAEMIEKAAHRNSSGPCWCLEKSVLTHRLKCVNLREALKAYRAARSKGGNDGR
jgi:hypothetical protein